jgi:hypothetical protein
MCDQEHGLRRLFASLIVTKQEYRHQLKSKFYIKLGWG